MPVESAFSLLHALERRGDTDVSDRTGELLDETRRMIERLGDSRALDAELEVPGLAMELRPFQRAGVRYAADVRRCIIGDEMGLGKTPQGLAMLQITNSWPAIVIVPAVVKVNWMREAMKWLPHLRIGACVWCSAAGVRQPARCMARQGRVPVR